ncbi:MAG: PDZ domain-containing protein [Acidobacteriota bacterium]|nr:PDZ domain-containing protein [Acidobacteriota bacterium]
MYTIWCLLFLFAQSEDAAVKSTVRMERPEHHFYQVEIVFPKDDKILREIKMADWTPGSYKIRDFARNVEQFQAFDPDEKPLTWVKTDKSTWVVNVPDKTAFKISYLVFAYEFTVRTSYLDNSYGFINPASVFFYEPEKIDHPYEVQVYPAQGWSADTSMSKRGTNLYRADDWDELVDSPILFGEFSRHNFDVRGIPHYWLIAGETNMNVPGMVNAMKKIGETVGDVFGGYPFANYYIFSCFRLDGAGGGLEHRNSTMVFGTADAFRDKKGWDRFLGLIIHEYFHAWNVKAIRDKSLGPFDYQKENYTNLLWVHEGWTSYYDTLLMARAGFWSDKDLLADFAKSLDSYLKRPGVKQQSLYSASFNAWIHLYQPNETTGNSRISYYSGGAMSGLALDLLIRHKTRNEGSLDDVMRILYQEYAQQGRNIDFSILTETLTGVMGEDITPFLDKHIRQPNPFDWETLLGYAGLEMTYEKPKKKENGEDAESNGDDAEETENESNETEEADAEDEPKPYEANPKVTMGITTRNRDDAVIIRDVLRDGPGWTAGLDFGDEIIAINGRRVRGNIDKVLSWSRPGDEVQVLLSRGNKIMTLPVKLDPKKEKLRLVLNENATELEKKIYDALFNPNGDKE